MDRLHTLEDEQSYQILQVRSNTEPEVRHTLIIDYEEEEVTCNCKGFRYHMTCRHERAIRELVKE